ncbi:MAG: Hsp20 family protein [Deltaproteobacteria bacterium]|nr:Hsp20 family protein [Deltaproteobacteria bacterium]
MAVSEKAKEKLDEASREIKEAIDNLKQEVVELSSKVKEKLKGTGEEMRVGVEELTREVKALSERVKDLIPKRRRSGQVPVRVQRTPGFYPGTWEQPFLELRRATDRLFDEFYRTFQWPMGRWRGPLGWPGEILQPDWPRVDVIEDDEEIRITAELPGVERDDLEVLLSEGRIIIRGEKGGQEEQKHRDYYQMERYYGAFSRSIPLPCEVDSEKVEATFRDGVLTILLPKREDARRRTRITVRAA